MRKTELSKTIKTLHGARIPAYCAGAVGCRCAVRLSLQTIVSIEFHCHGLSGCAWRFLKNWKFIKPNLSLGIII